MWKHPGESFNIYVTILVFAKLGLFFSVTNADTYFLQVQTEARSRGMGEVSAALPDNPAGFTFNPASLCHTKHFVFNGSYSDWIPEFFGDMKIFNFTSAMSLNEYGSVGLSSQLFRYSTIRFTDETGEPIGKETPYLAAVTCGYAIGIRRNMSVGVNMKLIRNDYGEMGAGREIGDGNATTFGFDFGVMVYDLVPILTVTNENLNFDNHPSGFARFAKRFGHPRSRGISLGLCLQNIGPSLQYNDYDNGEPLPHNLKLGFAYRGVDTDPIGFLIAADMNRNLVGDIGAVFREMIFNCGMELNLYRLIDIRGGYIHSVHDGSKYVTFGFGFGLDRFRFSYSRIPDGLDSGWLARTSFYELTAHF